MPRPSESQPSRSRVFALDAGRFIGDFVASMLVDVDVDVVAMDPEAINRALRTSGQWLATSQQLASWFENGDDVFAAIKGERKIDDRIAMTVTREIVIVHGIRH